MKNVKKRKFIYKDEEIVEAQLDEKSEKSFIFNGKLFTDLLQKHFELNFDNKNEECEYISINNKEILKKGEFSFFIGNFDKNKKKSEIEYIIDFGNQKDLNNELNYIIKIGVEAYFSEKIIFNIEDKDDMISPIFTEDKIIGYAYKYNKSIKDYQSSQNYVKYF